MSPRNSTELLNSKIGRRSFLKMGALTSVGAMAVCSADEPVVKATPQQLKEAYPGSKKVKTICTHCSVGCGVIAEVKDGVWVRQEVAQEHPVSLGGHCCKGADLIDKVKGTNRLKYPTLLQNGEWTRINWEQAYENISKQLKKIRETYGPDSVMFLGSAKVCNEQAYYIRKFAAFFGTNNNDCIARICHSPTVAGVANTLGYGGMTNHLGDMQNSKVILIMGANPAVNHPVGMQHILKGKENGAKIICIDPVYNKTCAHSDMYVRLRTGTDIVFLYGMIRLIVENNWHDKQYLNDRVFDWESIVEEAKEYTPDIVANICGCTAQQLIDVTTLYAKTSPGCLIWNQGWTQHTIGTSNTRLGPIMQMFLGNIGKVGGGCNILRGHDNVQGTSDMTVLSDGLPGYYPLNEGSWKYYSGQWQVDYEWLQGRFKSKEMMEKKGYAVSTWTWGVIDPENMKNNAGQPLKALICIGSGISTVSMTQKNKEALDKLDLVVFIDPYVNDSVVITDRTDNMFLLPAASQVETCGTVVNTNRNHQWRSKVVDPLYESKPDHEILFEFAKRLGFYEEYTRSLKNGKPSYEWPEDATREYNRSIKTIALQGVTPERMKRQQENWALFDPVTLKGSGVVEGEYYGLPWPCWSEKHPGTPIMYRTDISVMEGGMGFRAGWMDKGPDGKPVVVAEKNGQTLLSGTQPAGSRFKGGYLEITADNIESLGITLSAEEKEKVKGKNWKNDNTYILVNKALEAGLCPYGNGKARARVWDWADQLPKHREPLHSFRQDLVAKYPTFEDKKDHYRANIRYASEQNKQKWVEDFPVNVVTGRIVEHMGTGTETRASKYLAELAGEMYAHIHPTLAKKMGIDDGDMIWVHGTGDGKIKVKARYSYSVAETDIFMPQNFSGLWSGKSLVDKYPKGTAPYALGENSNQITSYGYDINTSCPETKCTLARIEKA